MPLTPGARLGPHEIVGLLGVGGMGEVWRATDKNLGRQVAIKVLPDAFVQNAERLARFEREAKTLAALSHANIAIIHGLEKVDGVPAIVMELVEGPTLADRIAMGPLPVEEALGIAKQISEALEAAHELGIVHRDLKPANVKVRQDGSVKVLDFGLAKALEPNPGASTDIAASPTITSPAMTQLGVILGTAAYMSPEQAKGRQADKRSDIWSFGAVLYEMLSGQRAFKGDDISDTFAAVLRQDIDWTALPGSTPASVRRLIGRCLDRDVKRRLRDIGEARIVLDDPAARAADAVATPVAVPRKPYWRRAIPVGLTAIAAAALGTLATLYLTPRPAPAVVARFPWEVAEGLVWISRGGRALAISPDGTRMAFTALRRDTGRQLLLLRPMSEPETRTLTEEAGSGFIGGLAFSPDGEFVAFYSPADRMIKKIGAGGGAVLPICRLDQTPMGVSWSADGIVFSLPNQGIMRVHPDGGTPQMLVSVKEGEEAYGPRVLPDGQTVLFTLANGSADDRWDRAQIVAHSLESGQRTVLVDGGSDARYIQTGHIVYARGGIVFARPMDLRRVEPLTGSPVSVVEGVLRSAGSNTGVAHFDVSNNGTLVYVPGPVSAQTSEQWDVGLVNREGVVELLKLPPDRYEHPRAAPKGKGNRIAFGTDDGKEATVWTYEVGGKASARPLTLGSNNRFPIWSPDGERVTFQSDRAGDLGIFWQSADGSGVVEQLTKPDPGTAHIPESWSPRGDVLLFAALKGSKVSLWSYSRHDKRATPFADVQSELRINAAFSPDGQLVAYNVTEGTMTGVYVQPFPPTGQIHKLSRTSTAHPVWASEGRELISQPTGRLWRVQTVTATGTNLTWSDAVPIPRDGVRGRGPASQRNYDVMPDGRILSIVPVGQTESPGSAAPKIQVVINWFEELKRRVPVK